MRSKRQKTEHQGALTAPENLLAGRMRNSPTTYFTTMQICQTTGRVSGRDVIRKLQAAGIKIGPAKLLRINDDGSRVYGWKMK